MTNKLLSSSDMIGQKGTHKLLYLPTFLPMCEEMLLDHVHMCQGLCHESAFLILLNAHQEYRPYFVCANDEVVIKRTILPWPSMLVTNSFRWLITLASFVYFSCCE